ncbi:ATP synthase gamma chain, chloroplastic [Capsicum chinense]|nr:ATP synthase gamma chain, chloroplastic [Capsicum chinense]
MKGVKRFGKKGKLSPRYVGPYKILSRYGKVAYELELPAELASVDLVFYVSLLNKCIDIGGTARALQESFASELAARMNAMSSATNNVVELRRNLSIAYNRERQEMNNMWTTVVGGSKKDRTYGTRFLQSSSTPPLFPSSSSTLQTVEEMEAMKKQIMELMQKCAANDARFAKFDKLEELVKKHMPQLFYDEEDNESDDN